MSDRRGRAARRGGVPAGARDEGVDGPPSGEPGAVEAAGEDAVGELTRFAARVLDVVDRIPPGRVLTYGDVAEYLGEGGPRGVGHVMARHGGAVAWWRVLRADGTVAPGLERRAFAHYRGEGTPLARGGTRVDLARARWDGR